MNTQLVGSIYVLFALPIWAMVAILFTITLAAILVGRDILEGLPYNVAYSAVIGDAGLMICVLIAATILQREGDYIYIPHWLQDWFIHILILIVSIELGIFICVSSIKSRSGQVMDIYHDVVIGPLIFYLAVTLLPIIFINGTKVEIAALLCFVFLWIGLVGFDIKYERMNQRAWLKNHGVTLRP